METLSKEIVVLTWFFRGLEDLFLAFRIESPFRHEPYFNTMGFEMISKSYLLAVNANIYENIEKNLAIRKIDQIAKGWRHNFEIIVNEIKKDIGNIKFSDILNKDYDGYTGNDFVKVMEAAYLECRYPVPNPIHEKFPIDGEPDMYWEPLCSSGLRKFCFEFTQNIMINLKEKYNIIIPRNEYDEIITGEAGIRFCNLFLNNMPNYVMK